MKETETALWDLANIRRWVAKEKRWVAKEKR
jgi:hypothetical protein